jgi:hypothetical protein
MVRNRHRGSRNHAVPLSDAALDVGQITVLDKAVGLKEDCTLHDLRRTVRTGLGKLGVQPHVAEAVLNHLPPKLIRTYDRNAYAAEKRLRSICGQRISRLVIAQVTGANVTAIRTA